MNMQERVSAEEWAIFRAHADKVRDAAKAHPHNTLLPYAVAYVDAATPDMTRDALRVQILYIINNTVTWRGDEARATKQMLRDLFPKPGAKRSAATAAPA